MIKTFLQKKQEFSSLQTSAAKLQ